MTAKKPISNPENYLKDIRRKTRRIFTAEQKILIVMEALRAETSIAELCRKHAIHASFRNKVLAEKLKASSTQRAHYLSTLDFATLRGLMATSRPWIGV